MTNVFTRDARTGTSTKLDLAETAPADVAALATRARQAGLWLKDLGVTGRATLLRCIADRIDEGNADLVSTADTETALGATRLRGEIARTTWQLRFLADVATDGAYLDIVVDCATTSPIGPQPDLRRMLVPVGPVAVFGASNFPFAFSTIGGDSASALAVGCPVIFKAHPGHPRTASALDAIVRDVIAAAGGPEGVFATVFGFDAGVALTDAPDIAAIGFTGSLSAGRALFDRTCRRPQPIPFYGELGSLNPVIVTPAAARERAAEIGEGIANSLLLGAGQFCTKPGISLIPSGSDGDKVVAALVAAVTRSESGPLLTQGIESRFREQVSHSCAQADVNVLGRSTAGHTVGLVVEMTPSADTESTPALEEHFGPFGVVIRYDNPNERDRILLGLPSSLTGTVQGALSEDPDVAPLVSALANYCGRVIVNQFPTGVAVAWAMHHGGPYPAATVSAATSVGGASVLRWLRPVTFQNTPAFALPFELRDNAFATFPHRFNGQLRIPTQLGEAQRQPEGKNA